jgi:hypothetical protein
MVATTLVATATIPATAAAAILLEEAACQGCAEADAGQDEEECHFQFAHVGLRETFILSRSTSQTAKKSQSHADDGRGEGHRAPRLPETRDFYPASPGADGIKVGRCEAGDCRRRRPAGCVGSGRELRA